MMRAVAQIWSIYDRDHRLVLAISDEPGIFNFARMPDDGLDPVEIPFATLQCYDPKAEPELLTHTVRSQDLEELLDRLRHAGFKVIEGRPRAMKFARL